MTALLVLVLFKKKISWIFYSFARCPRFCLLPGSSQINLLVLMLRMYQSIPTRTMADFLMVVECHLAAGSWEAYLVRKLLLQLGTDGEKRTITLERDLQQGLQATTALPVTTVDKIREICQQHFDRLPAQVTLKPLAAVAEDDKRNVTTSSTNSVPSERKRPRETTSDENYEGESSKKG